MLGKKAQILLATSMLREEVLLEILIYFIMLLCKEHLFTYLYLYNALILMHLKIGQGGRIRPSAPCADGLDSR